MSPLETYEQFRLGKTARLINASPTYQATITNGSGGKIFYKTAEDVGTGDTEVAVGSSVTVENVVWIISATNSTVTVTHPPAGGAFQDVTVSDKATVKGELEVDGAFNHDGETFGALGATPAKKAAKMTATKTASAEYKKEEIENAFTRITELEKGLVKFGFFTE